MIKFSTFAIDADDYCYQVGDLKVRTAKDKAGNEFQQEYIAKPLYCTSLQHAITAILRREQRRLINSGDYTLEQALTEINALQTRFEEHLASIKENMEVHNA